MIGSLPHPGQIVAVVVSYGFAALIAILVVWGLIALTVALAGEIGKTYRKYWPKKTKVPRITEPRFSSHTSPERVWPTLWTYRGPDRAAKTKERLRAH